MGQKRNRVNISFSDYSKYTQCGHKFLIENILRIPDPSYSINALFGEAIHEAIRKALSFELNVEETINDFRYKFQKDVKDYLSDDSDIYHLDDFLDQGANIIKLLTLEKISKKYRIIAIEKFVNDNLQDDFYFSGCIDIVLQNRSTGRYLIIDWKTSGSAWNEEYKKKDKTFVSQMLFYKHFYAKKHKIPMDNIDCKYVVLNRLKDKKNKDAGYGDIQNVSIDSNSDEIKEAVDNLKVAARKIYIEKIFEKAKFSKNRSSCIFCPYRTDDKLCNKDPDQYLKLLDSSED